MKLYLVLPCYNEEAVLPETAKRLRKKFDDLLFNATISPDSRIVFVNDGSKDRTWDIIQELHDSDPIFSGINLSRNKGHQNALLAGLMTVKEYADAVISMDADLQDDIDAVDEMVEKFLNGCDIVYGVRKKRDSDTAFKRFTAESFYKLMHLFGAEVVFNHADYRLMSRRALNALEDYREVNLFLRGMVPMIGYRSETVYYERSERFAGESKYPLKKMLSFAFERITSLSIKPIRFIFSLGILIFAVSLIMLLWSMVRYVTGNTIQGWTSVMFSVWALGGLQLLAIGVIGEYIGKDYMEAKRRPRFHVSEFIHQQEN